MSIGERIRQARLEKGISQRELCGEEITRNMLSLIENGAASPSLTTLQYLAGRLDKKVSWFLDEDTVSSPNQACITAAYSAWRAGDPAGAGSILEAYASPDPVFDRERELLSALVTLELAKKAMEQGRIPYAVQLLESVVPEEGGYGDRLLNRRKLLLLGKARPEKAGEICEALESPDEELLLRARAALNAGDPGKAAALLDAADRREEEWNLLRGEIWFMEKDYVHAAACYHKAEYRYPEKVISRLEHCYRELEDYKMAYRYACRQKREN